MEAVDLVTGCVAADVATHVLDRPGEVPPEDDGELVLGHLPEDAGGDRRVDGVDGRRVHADEQLVVRGVRLGEFVAQPRHRVEAVECEGAHLSSFRCLRPQAIVRRVAMLPRG